MSEHDHQCAWGCGNVADNVLVNLNTSEADILCTPCFLRLANDISEAWVKSLEEQGLMDPKALAPSAGTTEVGAATPADASGAPLSPPSPLSSQSEESSPTGDASGTGITDDPPEYEPSVDSNFGSELPYGDGCPTCRAVDSDPHEPGCIFG